VISKPASLPKENSEFTLAHNQLSRLGEPVQIALKDFLGSFEDTTSQRQQELTYRSMECSRWDFDGNFEETKGKLRVEYDGASKKPFLITDLNVYPLRYADESLKSMLLARGKMFWACRERKYVYYRNIDRSKASTGVSWLMSANFVL
jgi:hypothetical protein